MLDWLGLGGLLRHALALLVLLGLQSLLLGQFFFSAQIQLAIDRFARLDSFWDHARVKAVEIDAFFFRSFLRQLLECAGL